MTAFLIESFPARLLQRGWLNQHQAVSTRSGVQPTCHKKEPK